MGKIVGMIFGAIAAILAVFTGYFKFTKKPLPAFLANKLANFPKVLQFFNTPSPMMAQQMLMQQQTMINPAAQAAAAAVANPNQLAAMQQQGMMTPGPQMGGKRTKRTKKTKRTRKN